MIKAAVVNKGFSFKLAEPPDVEQIGIIGPAIYAESYGHMWSDAQAYAKQLATFGPAAMGCFMSRSDTSTWVVEYKTQIVGFLTLILGSPDPVDGRTDGAEVPRIYLLAPLQGHGIAKALLSEAEKYARSKGANHIWLDAMYAAPWAWQTYQKWGFSDIGRVTFQKGINPEFEAMVVLRRECR